MSDGVFVYDDDCGFCTRVAEYLADRADLLLVGFSELSDDQLARLPEEYEACSHLVTDDAVYSCGEGIEQALARADLPPGSRDVFDFLRQFSDYERLRERAYHVMADRRDVLGLFLSEREPRE